MIHLFSGISNDITFITIHRNRLLDFASTSDRPIKERADQISDQLFWKVTHLNCQERTILMYSSYQVPGNVVYSFIYMATEIRTSIMIACVHMIERIERNGGKPQKG